MSRITSAARLLAGVLLTLVVAVVPSARGETLDAYLRTYAQTHAFSGSVLVRRAGVDVYRGSFGQANRAFDVPNRDDTRYWIASITKLFTAVLVLQEVEAGRLDLDRPISAYLPDYAGAGRDQVTLRQLLQHTSGIANFDQVTSMQDALANGLPTYQSPFTTDQLLAKFCSGPLVHAPGTTFDYNNGDYIILGKVLERVSGTRFDALLQARILTPLGMRDSGLLRQDTVVPRLAETYFAREDIGRIVPSLPVYPDNWFAAGAMYATVDDLARFSDALFAGRLLGRASMAVLLAPGLDDYALGAWVYETTIAGRRHRVLKRPGAIMGAQAQFYRLLDDDTSVLVLSNVGNNDLDALVADIGKRVLTDAPAADAP